MSSFVLNGRLWNVIFADPESSWLIDKTRHHRLGVTDPSSRTIFLSDELRGRMLERVLLHEISHAVMASYGLIDQIHVLACRDRWSDAEEWVCNFIADYAAIILRAAYDILGADAWMAVPYELEKMIGVDR